MNKFWLLMWIDYKYLLFVNKMNIIRNRKKEYFLPVGSFDYTEEFLQAVRDNPVLEG